MAKYLNAKNNTAKPTRGVSISLLIQKQTNVYYMKMEILKRWKVTMEHQSIAVSLWVICHRLRRAILIDLQMAILDIFSAFFILDASRQNNWRNRRREDTDNDDEENLKDFTTIIRGEVWYESRPLDS